MRGAKFIGGQTQIAAFSLLATKYFNKIIHFPFKTISYWQPNMWTRYLIYNSFLVGWFLAFLADYNLSEWKTLGKIFGVCWVTSHQRNGNYPPNTKLPVGYTFTLEMGGCRSLFFTLHSYSKKNRPFLVFTLGGWVFFSLS